MPPSFFIDEARLKDNYFTKSLNPGKRRLTIHKITTLASAGPNGKVQKIRYISKALEFTKVPPTL